MRSISIIFPAILCLLVSITVITAQSTTDVLDTLVNQSGKSIREDHIIPGITHSTAATITSTTTGGNWSSAASWVGGVAPTNADNVVIAPGATVVIDTAAQAASVTVGTASGGQAARLTFQETASRTLTILSDLTIEADGVFSTGNGNVNDHTATLGGNLTNNGTLDLSTNGGAAGATIEFTGDSNSVFGGTGAVTDVSRIWTNKAAADDVVELLPTNFTVNGTATGGAASGYLVQSGGTFKISGTFTGAHRTFSVDDYWNAGANGFWLNNPNYTVTTSGQSSVITGGLRITAGEFNKGISFENGLTVFSLIMEGGKLNVSGGLWLGGGTKAISGGKITVCTAPGGSCSLGLVAVSGGNFTMSGGEIVMQNSTTYFLDATSANLPVLTGGTVRFGNELTSGPGNHKIGSFSEPINSPHAYLPNVVVDSSSGFPQTVTRSDSRPAHTLNLTIGPGGTFKTSALSFHGTELVNNGQLEVGGGSYSGALEFDDRTGLSDITYSGGGTVTGTVRSLNIRAHRLTFANPNNLVTYDLKVTDAEVVNAGRITLGRHDSTVSRTEMHNGASLDTAPVFDLGPSGQTLVYSGTNTTGPEINPNRYITAMEVGGPGTLTIAGGDIGAGWFMVMNGAVVKTGASKMLANFVISSGGGYVDGPLKIVFLPGSAGQTFLFAVGQNGYAPVSFYLQNSAGSLTVRAVDATLPGLDPTVSASRYWEFTEEGNIQVSQLNFTPNPADLNGNPANYVKWRSDGGTPVQVTTPSVDQLTGNWGVGQRLALTSVNISGTVTTSTGQPIRNAIVTISGGGLPAPVQTSTGNFGTYSFSGIPPYQAYTVNVSAKRYRFTPSTQIVAANDNITNLNFAANPEE